MTNPTDDRPSDQTDDPTSDPASTLPATIRGFLEAHAARDVGAALPAFTGDAVVTDQGETFRGTQEVTRFLRASGAEFDYTSELVGAERTDDQRWVATVHLEGDFPGGVADLRYRFTLRGEAISELHIGG